VTTPQILHLGPDTADRGGMGGSIQRFLDSPLAGRYEMQAVATWRRDAGSLRRVAVFASALAQLVRWCLRPGKRIVHVHAAVRGSWYRKCVCVAVARLLRRPVVLQLRSGPGDIAEFDARIGPLRRAGFRVAFRLPQRVVSVSSAGAREIEKRYGRRDVAVITNPSPMPVPAPEPPRDGKLRLLYLGGFQDPAKGADVLLEALPAVLERFPDAEVTLAGPGDPSPAAERLLAELPTTDWAGWLSADEKARALAQADVFVLPSTSEGMPNALLEAMAYGRAIVASSVGGVPDVLTDGVDAVLVPPSDPGRLADAIEELLTDAAARNRLGGAARARAATLSSGESEWEKLGALYDELAAAA
jgi:glycosyltransferase involved in cell wall biosynthesis